ncbi:MAG: glycosyltransferase [Bacteroidetes bacterium]|nr:glycosyltransferase [Bacteroidota bacterium]
MNYLAGVVVLYHPDQNDVIRNINSYIAGVDMLYIIDNSSQQFRGVLLNQIKGVDKIKYIFNGSNKGIGYALNLAAQMAADNEFQWLLTMDQDSGFEKSQLESYLRIFANNIRHRADIGVVGVSFDETSKPSQAETIINANKVITSGSIINLALWAKTGGFDEKLFIDEVDHEYCYRILKNGGQVMFLPSVFLDHILGNPTDKGYLSVLAKKKRTIYSRQRIYFMVRNYLYVRKKYIHFLPGEFKIRDKQVLGIIKNSLFFSGGFFGVLKKIFRAYRDYRNNDFSAVI